MLYLLSKLLPVPMRSTYGVFETERIGGPGIPMLGPDRYESARWWQWRGRVYLHRVNPAA